MLPTIGSGNSDAGIGIQVIARLRPMSAKELKSDTLPVVSASTERNEVTIIKHANRKTFLFDRVFTGFSTQVDVFDQAIAPICKDVLRGIDSTIFAYGQTGTGKTHTMEGDLASEEGRGIIPRVASHILEHFQQDASYVKFGVSASYLEIYNEELTDLLAQDTAPDKKLQVCEETGKNGTKLISVPGLTQKPVENVAAMLDVMHQAQERRHVGETKMNKFSSRSHCMFTLLVSSERALRDGTVLKAAAKLHLVDLAGSECAKSAAGDVAAVSNAAAKAAKARESERANINKSLLTLGRIITILKECQTNGQPVPRLPFRDSKLTRLLANALGGNSKTCIIATLSPSKLAVEESMSTLKYAEAAVGIINKPMQSASLGVRLSKGLLGAQGEGDAEAKGTSQDWAEMECRLTYAHQQ
ncbi:hypothetical protein CYMTET_52825, partial [Cymbomonas tetramitiformis]